MTKSKYLRLLILVIGLSASVEAAEVGAIGTKIDDAQLQQAKHDYLNANMWTEAKRIFARKAHKENLARFDQILRYDFSFWSERIDLVENAPQDSQRELVNALKGDLEYTPALFDQLPNLFAQTSDKFRSLEATIRMLIAQEKTVIRIRIEGSVSNAFTSDLLRNIFANYLTRRKYKPVYQWGQVQYPDEQVKIYELPLNEALLMASDVSVFTSFMSDYAKELKSKTIASDGRQRFSRKQKISYVNGDPTALQLMDFVEKGVHFQTFLSRAQLHLDATSPETYRDLIGNLLTPASQAASCLPKINNLKIIKN